MNKFGAHAISQICSKIRSVEHHIVLRHIVICRLVESFLIDEGIIQFVVFSLVPVKDNDDFLSTVYLIISLIRMALATSQT